MIAMGCYEGSTDIEEVDKKNTKKIEFVYISDYDQKISGLLEEWKKREQGSSLNQE